MEMFLKLYLAFFVLNSAFCDKRSFQRLMGFLARNSSTPHYRPNMELGIPVDVGMSIYIIGVHTVVEETGQLQLDCYLRTRWYNPSHIFPNNSGYEQIQMPASNSERYIWLPDVHLVEARETTQHTTFKEDGVVLIKEDGNVIRSSKMSFIFSCAFDLSSFPFDTQECIMSFESYAGTAADINMSWYDTSPVTVNYDVIDKISAFKYSDFKPRKRTEKGASGEYQRLEVTFNMTRHTSHYIVVYYLPTTFLVILGGLLFWLPVTSLQERTFYGAFLFLSSTIFVVSCQSGTPSVGYLKAIDVWCVGCMGFLFGAALEVMVLHLLRTKYTQHSTSTFHQMKEDEDNRTSDTANLSPTSSYIFRWGNIIPYLDLILKIVYPVVFVLFIIVYASLFH